jgi:hypothetical protein
MLLQWAFRHRKAATVGAACSALRCAASCSSPTGSDVSMRRWSGLRSRAATLYAGYLLVSEAVPLDPVTVADG